MTVFSVLVIDSGRTYYRPVIARMKSLEAALDIESFAVRNTPEQGGPPLRLTVTRLLKGLLIALGAIDLLGLGYVLIARVM
jgi:hypothetical protein